MHMYEFGFVIAGIFAVLFLLSMATGEVPGRRDRGIKRDKHPQMYWSNVGCMVVAALLAAGLGLMGWLNAH